MYLGHRMFPLNQVFKALTATGLLRNSTMFSSNICVFSLGVMVMFFSPSMAQDITTHGPHMHHSTREPVEADSALYMYDPHGNVLVMKKNSFCYFVPLGSAEQQLVHTSTGLRHLELSALQRVTSGVQHGITGSDLLHVSHKVFNFCAKSGLAKLDL